MPPLPLPTCSLGHWPSLLSTDWHNGVYPDCLTGRLAVSSNDGDKGLGPGTDFTFGDISYVHDSQPKPVLAHCGTTHLSLFLLCGCFVYIIMSSVGSMFEVVNAATALLKPGILRSYPNLKVPSRLRRVSVRADASAMAR